MQVVSPQSHYSASTSYDTETAPLRWFGLLAGDAANVGKDASPNDSLGITALSPQLQQNYADSTSQSPPVSTPNYAETVALQNASILVEPPVNTPMSNSSTGIDDERSHWQSSDPVQLQRHEHIIYQHYVTGVSLWIDLLDPFRHFATYVPHIALKNEGLMKAVLALGSRYLSIKSTDRSEIQFCQNAAKQYYQETLQYLQSAMRYVSYKNSPELLITVLILSTYEMIDGPSRNWERHLKGVYWIQRSRNIHRETSRLELAIWWAWLRQDVWAAFRERRRCFSSFQPPRPCVITYNWDMATQIWWILGQAVNYSSDVEKEQGQDKVADRILTGNNLLGALERWRESTSVHFQPLPYEDHARQAFKPLWFQPSAIGTALQVYCMARILLLVHQPAAGGFLEIMGRDRKIMECVETIGGIALKLDDEASCMVSIQCLFAAGRYCTDASKREDIADIVRKHSVVTGWPSNVDLVDELRSGWAKTPR